MIHIRNKGMTLIELLVSMTVFSLVMITAISAIQSMTLARLKSMNRIALIEQLYFFSEQFFTEIKDGGTIDYEEYWNRHAYNHEYSISLVSSTPSIGHYKIPSGFGNYGQGGNVTSVIVPNYGSAPYGSAPYYCMSGDGVTASDTSKLLDSTTGCLNNERAVNASGTSITPANLSGTPQRYGEYAIQFWDYNYPSFSEFETSDHGDQNGDDTIIGDEDDRNNWDGPIVFSTVLPELYLIDTEKNIRTYFRWTVQQDLNAPDTDTCTITGTAKTGYVAGAGCRGNVQILRLEGHDYGWNHDGDITQGAFDGKIDTWTCMSGWVCAGPELDETQFGGGIRIATGADSEWINLFPSTINVKRLTFELYPQKDPWLAVAAPDCTSASLDDCISPFIHPYVRYNMEIGFSYGKRRILRGEDPTISISTTASLDDFR